MTAHDSVFVLWCNLSCVYDKSRKMNHHKTLTIMLQDLTLLLLLNELFLSDLPMNIFSLLAYFNWNHSHMNICLLIIHVVCKNSFQ